MRDLNKTVPLWAGPCANFNSARNLIEWNTEAYDIRSAWGLSEGTGLSPFIIRESKSRGSEFSERAKMQNCKPVS